MTILEKEAKQYADTQWVHELESPRGSVLSAFEAGFLRAIDLMADEFGSWMEAGNHQQAMRDFWKKE